MKRISLLNHMYNWVESYKILFVYTMFEKSYTEHYIRPCACT